VKKLILIGIPLLILLVFVGLIFVALSANSAIEKGVEYAGAHYLQVPVEVASVSVSPISGKGTIAGVVIGNPDGFNTEHAFSLGKVHVKLDLGSLFSDTIVVEELHIIEPDITYEVGLGKTNIGQLKANVMAKAPAGDDSAEEAPTEDHAPGKNLVIQDFQLNGAKVAASVTILQGARGAIVLEDIKLENVSQDSAAEVVAVVFTAVADSVLSKAGELVGGTGDAVETGRKALGAMKSFLGGKSKDSEE
jgi:hypothetical protein